MRTGALSGMRVVVTREEDPGGPLSDALQARGATVIHWPAVQTAPPADPTALEAEVSRLAAFDWVVFTSHRAVAAVVALRPDPPPDLLVAVVGDRTADAVVRSGWHVHLVPATATGEGVVDALGRAGVRRGRRVLFPASEIARDTVPRGLRELGAEVVQVTAYRTVPARLDTAACQRAFDEGIDVVTFTSPSAVSSLRAALGDVLFGAVLAGTRVAAIGPTTGGAAREAGASEVIEASSSTFEGLADGIVAATGGP